MVHSIVLRFTASVLVGAAASGAEVFLPFEPPAALNSRAAQDTGHDAGVQFVATPRGWLAVWSVSSALEDTGADLDIVFACSEDGGRTWSDQESLNTNAAIDNGDDTRPQIAADGLDVLAVWQSDTAVGEIGSGDHNIFSATSTDGGRTWQDPVLVNGMVEDSAGVPDLNPDIASDGQGTFLAVWESEDRLGGTVGTRINVVFASSNDRGATWTDPALVALNTENDIDFDLRPRVSADRINWVVVWQSADDLRGTIRHDRDILSSASSTNGRSWSEPQPVNTTASLDDEPDLEPEIATDEAGTWLVAWTSEHDLSGQIGMDRDILTARSADGGQTWSTPVPGNTSAFDDQRSDEQAHIATDGDGVWVVAWVTTENLQGRLGLDGDAVFAVSTDDGATWSAPDLLDTNAAVDDQADVQPRVAGDRNGTWIGAWESSETVGGATGEDGDLLFGRAELQRGADPPGGNGGSPCGVMEPVLLLLTTALLARRLITPRSPRPAFSGAASKSPAGQSQPER